jgi:hypothetical protein
MGEQSKHYRNRYGTWAGDPEGRRPDFTRCCVSVTPNERGGGARTHQCFRARGHGPDEAYCKQHDPATVKARAAKADEEYRVKHYAEMKRWCGPSFLEALRKIAAGHNDPRTFATEIVEDFDARYKPATQHQEKKP